MTDTPEHIKKLQLELWLSKTPAERLRQTLLDIEGWSLFFKEGKKQMDKIREQANKKEDRH